MPNVHHLSLCSILLLGLACSDDNHPDTSGNNTAPRDPESATNATIDRFSTTAAMLMARDGNSALPAAGHAIDFDQPPFITAGLAPNGKKVKYYNFDVRPTAPAPIYVFFKPGATTPVDGQLNVVSVVPGTAGYNDFWLVTKVAVPATYVANTVTSFEALQAAAFPLTPTDMIVNCPVVPPGSTATLRGGGSTDTQLHRGWYKDQVIYYFNFSEKALTTGTDGAVPTSPIYVAFNTNPDQPGGGPPSGFKAETGTMQTHNVVGTLPTDAGYSPLWSVNPYDNAAFSTVTDLPTVLQSHVLAMGVALVNCPIVFVEP